MNKKCVTLGVQVAITALTAFFGVRPAEARIATPAVTANCADAAQLAALNAGLAKALEKVESCLMGARGLNNAMGQEIKDLVEGRKGKQIRLSCMAPETKGAGSTVHEGNTVLISIKANVLSPLDPLSNAALVFHELIHAADPDSRYLLSKRHHNLGKGFPDKVYGCFIACFANEFDLTMEIEQFKEFRASHRGFSVPELRRQPCPAKTLIDAPLGPEECSYLRKYARICEKGTKLPKKTRQAACLLDRLFIDCETPACRAITQAYLDLKARRNQEGGREAFRAYVLDLERFCERLVTALKASSASGLERHNRYDERALFDAAKAGGFMGRCEDR